MSTKDLQTAEKVIEITPIVTKPYYNSRNLPPKPTKVIEGVTKVQEGPYDAKSPQEVLEKYGMYKDDSIYSKNPEAFFADLTQIPDYETQLNLNKLLQSKFKLLDPEIRAKYHNNIHEFVSYCTSKDFDITEVLTKKQNEAYQKVLKSRKDKSDYEKYLNSDEYKKQQAEYLQRQAYEQAKYEEWKATQSGSIK